MPEDQKYNLIFTSAPAGLGHLRVIHALTQGLPKGTKYHILGTDDKFINVFHRLTSIYPLTRWLMEHIQSGILEDVFTLFYRWYLRNFDHEITEKVISLIKQQKNPNLPVFIVAAHFGLAHRLAAIRNSLRATLNAPVYLIVQVTDDTPQRIWYVTGSDLTFVPSDRIKNELIKYGQKKKFPRVNFVVNPYPTNPLLAIQMADKALSDRFSQLNRSSQNSIQVMVPIPGAAVGLGYLNSLISEMKQIAPQFIFRIVGKKTAHTKSFIRHCRKLQNVELSLSAGDWDVIQNYEREYQQHIISLEITKPSEQAFKALFNPNDIGGSLLLFTNPIGKQEYDNLDFLRRHHLIPTINQQSQIISAFNSNQVYSESTNWRGILLPQNPKTAAQFILWCLKSGIFTQMLNFRHPAIDSNEIGSNGTALFWVKVLSLSRFPDLDRLN